MRILVADDDHMIRMIVSYYFSNKSFEIKLAIDGNDAYQQYINEPKEFDLLITDIMMPQLNGVELAEKIKLHDPDFPIIAITAGNIEDILPYDDLFLGVYNKPLELSQLHEIVLQAIRNNSN